MARRGRFSGFIIAAMAGRRRRVSAVFVMALVAMLVLSCIASLLQFDFPGKPFWQRSDISIGAGADPALREAIASHWRGSPTMLFLSGLYLGVDALLFVPLYAVLLTGLRGRWSAGLPAWTRAWLRWRRWRWLLSVAVCADLLENVLTWGFVESMAVGGPLRVVSWTKWCAVLLLGGLLLLSALLRYRRHRVPWRLQLRRVLEATRDAARYLWTYAIPLAMLFGGLGILAWVPQTREIIADFGTIDSLSSSRLGTLVTTGFMLVIWVSATGLAFAFIHGATLSVSSPEIRHEAATLPYGPQLMVGCAALVATTAVLVRMSTHPGVAMALFIVVGSVSLWVLTARICEAVFSTLKLPKHRRPTPVGWRAVTSGILLFALLLAAWRFLPAPRESALATWGLYREPDGLWRFNPALLDATACNLVLGAMAVGLLVLGGRISHRSQSVRRAAMLCGMLLWMAVAGYAQGWLAVLVQSGTIVLASAALWLLTHRSTLKEYEDWRDTMIQGTSRIKLPHLPSSAVPWVLNRLIGTIGSMLLRFVAALVIVFFLLPFSQDPGVAADAGTLAVAFAALAIWGLLGAWLLVALPLRHGLGNWTLAPLLWAAMVGALPRGAPHADPQDNPSLHTPRSDPLPTLHQHLAAWRQQLPTQKSPMFVVAAAGGGLRAAYWTATLLAEMDDRTCGQFGRHVLAGSGVSGGSLGLALYAAQRRIWEAKPPAEHCEPGRAPQMRRILSGDFLAPIVAGLLFADAPIAMLPFVSKSQDRNDALARAITQRWTKEFAGDANAAGLINRPFLDAVPAWSSAPSRQATAPVLYFNATAVETGRRVIASNVTLGSMPADPFLFESTAGRGTRLLTAQTSLLDAALHSARFPGVSPAGQVLACSAFSGAPDQQACTPDGAPYGLDVWVHLVDGGYFENSGLETLGDAMQVLQQAGANTVHAELPPTYVIAISNDRNTPAQCAYPTPRVAAETMFSMPAEADPTRRIGEPAGGLSAMWEALLQVREGRARLELQRSIRRYGCRNVLEWSLGAMLRTDEQEPALGWMLSAASMRAMDKGVQTYADNFPFDLAACPASQGPAPRGWLGDAKDQHVRCRGGTR